MSTNPPVDSASQQLLQAIEQTTQRIVSGDDFVARLAQQIVAQQQALSFQQPQTVGDLPVASAPNQPEFIRHMVAEPQPTPSGKFLVLSHRPARGGLNALLTLQVKDPELLNLPTPEGERLRNYAMTLVVEHSLGDLSSRSFFSFEAFGEDAGALVTELHRQLELLPLQQVAFLYLNVLQNDTVQSPAAGSLQ